MIPRLGLGPSPGQTATLAAALAGEGLLPAAAKAKAESLARCAAAAGSIRTGRWRAPLRAYFVPGRIEVFGKHTDYAGGMSLVAAADRGFCLVAAPRDDSQVEVLDVARAERVAFELGRDVRPRTGHWANYPMTVARRIARNFPGATRGASIAMESDLAPAAGMSSSSAMIVAVFLALAEVNDLWDRLDLRHDVRDRIDLASYLAAVENGQSFRTLSGDRGVGTFGGSEDHTAILNARSGHLGHFSYCPVRRLREVPMPEGCVFAIGTSGVVAEKTGAAMAAYNRASALAARAAEIWRDATGREERHLAAALATGRDAADQLAGAIRAARLPRQDEEALLARLAHFEIESREVLPAAVKAFADGDVHALGAISDRSQRAAEQYLGNQVPETSRLAALARSCGAPAASAFGAGFGGSVWALVERDEAEGLLARWSESYRSERPRRAAASAFFLTAAGPAAMRIS